MKKSLSIVFLIFLSIFSAQEKVEKPQSLGLEDPKSWSMVILPDTQNYAKWNRNQPIFDLMTRWIEDHVEELNIKMVLHVGDIVEHNNILNQGYDGDQSAQKQWEAMQTSLGRLNGLVPYITATGNHDISINEKGERRSRVDEFFPIDFNSLNKKALRMNLYNEQGDPSLENAAYELKDLNGVDYLFLCLEYAPKDETLEWAKKVVDLTEYKNHRVIVLTHAYLNAKSERTSGEVKWFQYAPFVVNNVPQKNPTMRLPRSNNGEQIFQKLIQPSINVEMVFSGHISGEGFKLDKNSANKIVSQILFDQQSVGGGHRNGNGGDGWLRILEFHPDNQTVTVKTFSPLFWISPSTRESAYRKEAKDEFQFKLSKPKP